MVPGRKCVLLGLLLRRPLGIAEIAATSGPPTEWRAVGVGASGIRERGQRHEHTLIREVCLRVCRRA